MSSLETTHRRSALMRRVRRHGTKPERIVRKLLWSLGARYRLNVVDLPGTPDIANKQRTKAIFVHGCFWHFHRDCPRGRLPDRNRSFWAEKFERNRARDKHKKDCLRELGYDVLVVWECELTDLKDLGDRLESFWFESP